MTRIGTNFKVASPAPALKTPTEQQTEPGGLKHMQSLTRSQRATLLQGEKLQFVDAAGATIFSGTQVPQIPLRLFKAASSLPSLIAEGKVIVPKYIDPSALNSLFFLVLALPSAEKVTQFGPHVVKDAQGRPIPGAEDSYKDLHLCSAADALGLGSFTQGLFNHFFLRVKTAVPGKSIIDMMTAARGPTADKLFRQMAYTIASKLHSGTFSTGDAFTQHYLPTNPRLEQAIQTHLHQFSEKEKREVAERERKAEREEKAREQREFKRLREEQGATRAAREKFQEDRSDEWKAAGASYRQKAREGRKDLTLIEVRYAWKEMGKRVAAKGGA